MRQRILEQNAKKAEAARLRYHRMTEEEKRIYNQRRFFYNSVFFLRLQITALHWIFILWNMFDKISEQRHSVVVGYKKRYYFLLLQGELVLKL